MKLRKEEEDLHFWMRLKRRRTTMKKRERHWTRASMMRGRELEPNEDDDDGAVDEENDGVDAVTTP
jgi:hypothetical protein